MTTDRTRWLTVGIVAFRRPDALADALAALAAPDIDVVVVNVGADPEVAVVASRARNARTIAVENRGYAAAVNAMAATAIGDVVVFMNDDARLDAAGARALAAVVRAGVADVAVPRVVGRDGRLERTVAAVPSPAALAREWLLLPDEPVASVAGRVRVEKWRAPEQPERVEAASAIAVAARTDLVLDVRLPEHYFLYWEESEWFWRLRERGAVVQYRPEVTCVHDGGRDDVRPEKSRLLARNAVRCVRITQGRARAAAAWLVVVAWNVRLVLVDGARCVVAPGPRRRARLRARAAGLAAAGSSWREIR
jgi:GT2 family glycosyltransferase